MATKAQNLAEINDLIDALQQHFPKCTIHQHPTDFVAGWQAQTVVVPGGWSLVVDANRRGVWSTIWSDEADRTGSYTQIRNLRPDQAVRILLILVGV